MNLFATEKWLRHTQEYHILKIQTGVLKLLISSYAGYTEIECIVG